MERDKTGENAISKTPWWLVEVPEKRRCSARSKRSGERCKNWSMRGSTVCRFHGARGGPKTESGKQRIAEAHLVHGAYALDILKARAIERLRAALALHFIRNNTAVWVMRYFNGQIGRLNYAQYRQIRPAISAFCKGDISFPRLGAYFEGRRDPIELLDRRT